MTFSLGLSSCLVVRNLLANAGDTGSILVSGRYTGEGNGNLLQCSCLGKVRHRGVLQATVHGVAKEVDMTQRLGFPCGSAG